MKPFAIARKEACRSWSNHMKKVAVFLFGLVIALSTITPAHGQDTLTVKFSDPSRPGLLKVTLFNGGIVVRTHSASDVIIDSKASSHRGRQFPPAASEGLRRIDSSAAGLSVEEENNVMTINTRNFDRSGDFEIQVPAKTNLNLKTFNGGEILVEGVEGDIEVENSNGRVVLNNVAGSVVAHSMNGRVVASLREIVPNKPMSFTSMNGNVDVTLPATAKANLRMRADHGGTYSDFDIQLRPVTPTTDDTRNRGGRFRLETDKVLNGTINGGGPDIDLRTLNGNIYIRKTK
jgi:hypothetical protein